MLQMCNRLPKLFSHELNCLKGVFVLEPQKGTLERGQRATVRVSFYPRERKNYGALIPVYLDKKDRIYLEFELKVFILCKCTIEHQL
jgi:hypothetical protein